MNLMNNWENFPWGAHEGSNFIGLIWLYNTGKIAPGRDERQEES